MVAKMVVVVAVVVAAAVVDAVAAVEDSQTFVRKPLAWDRQKEIKMSVVHSSVPDLNMLPHRWVEEEEVERLHHC